MKVCRKEVLQAVGSITPFDASVDQTGAANDWRLEADVCSNNRSSNPIAPTILQKRHFGKYVEVPSRF